MRRASVSFVALVALICLAVAGAAAAQPHVVVQVAGVPSGSTLQVTLAFANLNKTESLGSVEADGIGTGVLDFANFGKPPSDQEPVQVYVYYDCEEDELLISDTPRDDEDCQSLGIIFLSGRTTRITANVAAGTVQAHESGAMTGGLFGGGGGPGLTFGVSVDFNRYPDAENNVSPEMSDIGGFARNRRSLDLKDTATDVDITVDYWVMPWLGAGLSWERMGKVELDETFDFPQIPGLTQTFNGFFDVQMVDFHVMPAFPIGDMVKVWGYVGVARWSGESGGDADLIFDGDVVDSISNRQDDSGTTGIYGAGVSIWPWNAVGFSAYYKQAQLKDTDKPEDEGEVDEKFRKFGISVNLNLWGR